MHPHKHSSPKTEQTQGSGNETMTKYDLSQCQLTSVLCIGSLHMDFKLAKA